MARQNQNTAAPANPNSQVQDNSYRVPNAQNNPTQVAALNQAIAFPPVPPPVNVPALAATFAQQTPGSNNGAQNYASNQTNHHAAIPPIAPPSALDPAVAQQLLLIKRLTDAGVAPDQIPGVIAALGSQGAALLGAGGIPPPLPHQFPMQNQNQNAQNGQSAWGANGRLEESRDRNGYDREGVRSPGRDRRRSRSRSPPRVWNARDSPAYRHDESGFDYDRNSPGQNRDDRGRGSRGGRTNDYRQRSPPRRGRSPTPPRSQYTGEKWIGHDASIGKGNIKGIENSFPLSKALYLHCIVLSRTLFVGGVT